MIRFFKNIEIEWKVLILAAFLLLTFALPLQRMSVSKLSVTLDQSIDPQLEPLLRLSLKDADDSTRMVILSSIERNRQWKALIPIIVEEQTFAMILISIALFIALLIFSFWLLRKLTRPLKNLASAADEIGKGTVVQINGMSGGALGRLEKSMIMMQDELIKLRDRAHMQGMESAWRDIARVMAHEIKNPLTPIQLTLDRISDRFDRGSEISKEEMIKFVSRIGTQVTNLERLVNDFRSFSKEPEPILTKVPVREAIAQIAHDMNGVIKTDITGDATIEADIRLLERVLLNIWKNSHEANADKMIVIIDNTGGTVRITLTDNGAGIPEDKVQMVFIPYVTFKKGGTGLGLPIVKRIIESMGGTVELQSSTAAENHGVTIICTFKAFTESAS